jgi:hypothetical protein
MFSRLAELEGFSTTSQYYNNQDTTYNEYLPKIIPSAYGKPSVDITPALRSINPQNDIQNASALFTAIPMVSDRANETNQACTAASSISDVIDQGATQCGWFYTPPVTTTSPIPKYNRGFLAAGEGPAPLLNAPDSNQYQYVFSDQLPDGKKLADGKKRILTDICKSLRTCTDVAKTPYNNLCGFCTDIGQGIPIDSNGAPLYTGPNIGCRPEGLITQANKCPPPSPIPPKNGCLPGQPFNAACLRDALVQTGCDNGTLIQSLQGWTTNKDKNTAKIQDLRAVQKYNGAGKPAFDLSQFLGTGNNPSQTDAVREISSILSFTGTANKSLKGYASRELCVTPNALDDYDFCADLNVGTPKPGASWDLNCLQHAFKQAGGTPSGAQYPATASSPGTIMFNGMSTWGAVTDWMKKEYTQARGVVSQGFAPSQFGGNKDPFVDMAAQTTANYQTQSDALKNMIGSPLQSVLQNYIASSDIINMIMNQKDPINIKMNLVSSPVSDPNTSPSTPVVKDSNGNITVEKYEKGNNNYTFVIVPANNGGRGYISFKTNGQMPGYLRHAGFQLQRNFLPNNYNNLFNMDSSFKPVAALNGKNFMVSFQSANFPDRYLTTLPGASGVYIRPVDPVLGALSDKERASWLIYTVN